jgi:uncharacterized membrane protein YeaQ/YmgE (transglycosylase-associated protein family)
VLIIAILIWGMVAGGLAWVVLRGGPMRNVNWPEALVAGVVGSFVGGLLISLVSGDGLELRPSGLIGSFVGALIVLGVWGWARGRSA